MRMGERLPYFLMDEALELGGPTTPPGTISTKNIAMPFEFIDFWASKLYLRCHKSFP